MLHPIRGDYLTLDGTPRPPGCSVRFMSTSGLKSIVILGCLAALSACSSTGAEGTSTGSDGKTSAPMVSGFRVMTKPANPVEFDEAVDHKNGVSVMVSEVRMYTATPAVMKAAGLFPNTPGVRFTVQVYNQGAGPWDASNLRVNVSDESSVGVVLEQICDAPAGFVCQSAGILPSGASATLNFAFAEPTGKEPIEISVIPGDEPKMLQWHGTPEDKIA